MSAYAGWAGSLAAEEVRDRLERARRITRRPLGEWIPQLLDTLLPAGSPTALADELSTMLADLHPDATRTALEAFAEADLRATLPRIEVPTLLVYGELDVRSPRQAYQAIHDAVPGAELVVIPHVGHMVDMQAPQRVNAEIRAFLRLQDAA